MLATACALGLMAVSSASGALIMTINTTDKTFAFSGSDTGTPGLLNVDGTGAATFNYMSAGANLGVYESLTLANVLSYSPNTVTSQEFSARDMMGARGGEMVLQFSTTASVTLTGTGLSQSYASFSDNAAGVFEGLGGHTLGLYFGSGFSGIAVQVVPEPTSVALLGLGAAALALRPPPRSDGVVVRAVFSPQKHEETSSAIT